MKLKCPNLLKQLDAINQETYQPFYPSEPFRILRFQMRHPVDRGQEIRDKPTYSNATYTFMCLGKENYEAPA